MRIFLLVVDRDCDDKRRAKLRTLERKAQALFRGSDRVLLAEHAWQEVEVWVLAGLKDLPNGWAWTKIRAECHPKERYYEDYAKRRGVLQRPYKGRDELAREAARNYPRVRKLCPEDVGALEKRLRDIL
ncbi:hypothetical protein [Haliangium sp.]|uniref:hypothetical protein n=1 Tax=Haliangium sp. TaxID=2663208 RepID=UPI003D0ED2E0